jgi:phage terminase large subunit-like protein
MLNEEFARRAHREKDGERYEDFLQAFTETGGDADALVPCYVEGRMFMFWDEGWEAHRNPDEQTAEYYEEEQKTNPPQQFQRIHLNLWVSDVSTAIPMEWWNACYDPDLPPLTPAEPMILSLDAGTTSDNFAAVAVTRHPMDLQRPAIRAAKVWKPEDFPDHRIDYDEVWKWIAHVCQTHRIVQVVYDPHQLEDMSQRIRRELEKWAEPMHQASERKIADRKFYNQVRDGVLAWNLHDPAGEAAMRLHIGNANAKHQKDQDSTMLFIKKTANRKIDLLVAASMGVHRCMALFMEAA